MARRLAHELDGEHIAVLYSLAPTVYVGQTVSAVVMCLLLWTGHGASVASLSWWLLFIHISMSIRWFDYVRYRKDALRLRRAQYWSRRFTGGTVLTGLVWGSMGWLFYSPDSAFQFSAVMLLAAQIALSVPSVGTYFPAHAAYNLLAMGPFTLRTFMQPGSWSLVCGAALLTLMASCLVFSRRQQALIRESIRLRLENKILLDEVTEENIRASNARKEAEASNLAKSRFLAAASHDLRQPLQALAMFIDVIADDCRQHRPLQPAVVNKLTSASDSVGAMLDALLDLSSAESGRPAVLRNVALGPLFDRLRHAFTDQAAVRELELRIVPTRHSVLSDPDVLERILHNLIANAIRYTPRGSILVACRYQEQDLRIEVRDSGLGIASEHQQLIFEAFHQVGNSERDRRQGLGLGLSIARAQARLMGSDIGVRSALGCGSVFYMCLPRVSPQSSAPDVNRTSDDRLAGHCIVVMEDDLMVREALVELFYRWGCAVVAGENADEIITQLAESGLRPSVILSDWRLRQARLGNEEARRVRDNVGFPVITLILSGDLNPDPPIPGEFPVLHKPVQPFRLRAEIEARLFPSPQADPAVLAKFIRTKTSGQR